LLLVPFPSLGVAASMFWWPGSVLGQALFVLGKVWVVLLPLAWLFWVEQGRVGWSPPRLGGFGTAVLLGLVLAAFILLAYGVVHRLGWIDPGQVADRARQTGLGRFGVYLGGAVYWITLNSLMEEYVWRWFCFRQCEVLFGGIGGVFAAAAGFTLHHVIALAAQFSWPLTLAASFGVFCAGAIWSWLYLRYRSIWPCYVSHAIADVPIFVVGYWLIFGAA
jgi:membrane protease YdiL (CAAX protease family)